MKLADDIDAEERRFHLAELPKITISDDSWRELLNHGGFRDKSLPIVKRRIREALARFVKSVELHNKRKSYHRARKDICKHLATALTHLDTFLKLDKAQPQLDVNISDVPDRIYSIPKDAQAIREAVTRFTETIETFEFLSPRELTTGRNNVSAAHLVRTLNDIATRHSMHGALRPSDINHVVKDENKTKIGGTYNDVQFVKAVMMFGLEKARPFLRGKSVSLSRNMDNFVRLMIRDVVSEGKSQDPEHRSSIQNQIVVM